MKICIAGCCAFQISTALERRTIVPKSLFPDPAKRRNSGPPAGVAAPLGVEPGFEPCADCLDTWLECPVEVAFDLTLAVLVEPVFDTNA